MKKTKKLSSSDGMNILKKGGKMNQNDVARVWLTDDAVYVELNNGQIERELFSDYSRLADATKEEREDYTLSFFGIHWPTIDEDLSFQGFFNKPVGE
ncbi:MAG: DUF2442 domain-containing protein [Clostridium sp.]|nr:DUF2442 domain-containing protein [Clostridium sp.]